MKFCEMSLKYYYFLLLFITMCFFSNKNSSTNIIRHKTILSNITRIKTQILLFKNNMSFHLINISRNVNRNIYFISLNADYFFVFFITVLFIPPFKIRKSAV